MIVLIILVGIIGFQIYRSYHFNKYVKHLENVSNDNFEENDTEKTDDEEESEDLAEEETEEYENIIEPLQISENTENNSVFERKTLKEKISDWQEKRKAEKNSQEYLKSIYKQMEKRAKESNIFEEKIMYTEGFKQPWHVYFEYIIKGDKYTTTRRCDLETEEDAKIMLKEFKNAYYAECGRVAAHAETIKTIDIIAIAILVIFILCL